MLPRVRPNASEAMHGRKYAPEGTLMTIRKTSLPFAFPRKIEPSLKRIFGYWEGLKRGQAEMPFADDVRLGALEGLEENLLLLDVFEKPGRFRFASAGRHIVDYYGRDLEGEFVDEIEGRAPLGYMFSQCSATVEAHAPTFFRHVSGKAVTEDYARVLFPLWGDGHVSMLLGAVVWSKRRAAQRKAAKKPVVTRNKAAR